MKETSLLLGNGVNRLGQGGGPSWGQLLKDLQRSVNCSVDLQNDFKPFPMAFEEMLMTNCSDYGQRIRKFKSTISKTFKETIPNHIHQKILASNAVTNYLTTNYDYSLEKVFIPDFSNLDQKQTTFVTKEIKYSLRRRNSIFDPLSGAEKKIWHIHGELYDPKNYQEQKRNYKEESILIGYEHYSEALKVMQDYKNGRNKWAKTPLKQKLLQSSSLGESWIDYFFTTKLIIVGLDLSFSEIDLWWLLNFRARWLKEYGSKNRIPLNIRGQVIFMYPNFDAKAVKGVAKTFKISSETVRRDVEKNMARAQVLRAFEVDIEEVQSKDYEDFYLKVIARHL